MKGLTKTKSSTQVEANAIIQDYVQVEDFIQLGGCAPVESYVQGENLTEVNNSAQVEDLNPGRRFRLGRRRASGDKAHIKDRSKCVESQVYGKSNVRHPRHSTGGRGLLAVYPVDVAPWRSHILKLPTLASFVCCLPLYYRGI